MPCAENHGGIRAERAHFQARKQQLTHALPVRIVLLIPFEETVISPNNALAPGKGEIRGVPVALKEGPQIATVPGILLRA